MKLFRTTVLLATFATMVWAQGPGNGPRGNGPNGNGERPQPTYDELAEIVRLTPEQIDELNDIRSRFAQEIQGNLMAIREKQQAAQAELEAEDPNPTLIGQLQLDARAMRETVRDMEDAFVAEAQGVLDAGQQAALSQLVRIAPFMTHVRQGQALGLIPGRDGEYSLAVGGGRGGNNRGPRGPRGRNRPNPDEAEQ